MPCYPRWASSSTPGELLMGKSWWRPEPHSLGVGWWSRDALHVTRGSSSGSQIRSMGSEGSMPPSDGIPLVNAFWVLNTA
jgi:hypothetical protein